MKYENRQGILKDLETKKGIYESDDFALQEDSFTGALLNPEFEAIDRGNYERMTTYKRADQVNKQLSQLRQGKKIILGVGCC